MTLSTSHKALFAVLALAVAALLFDWIFLRGGAAGPTQANASVGAVEEVEPPPPPASPSEPPAGAGEKPDTEPPPLADRLQTVARTLALDPTRMRDAFVPSEDWLSELKPPEPVAAPPDPAEGFGQRHSLSSVILMGAGGSAVVDGRAVRVGQELDGFRLLRLTPTGAIFQSGDRQVELRLRPAGDTP